MIEKLHDSDFLLRTAARLALAFYRGGGTIYHVSMKDFKTFVGEWDDVNPYPFFNQLQKVCGSYGWCLIGGFFFFGIIAVSIAYLERKTQPLSLFFDEDVKQSEDDLRKEVLLFIQKEHLEFI